VGAIANDGGPGTALTELFGDTVPGTAVLETTEASTQDITIEESDDPIETITTEPQRWTLAFHSYNLSPEVLQTLFGGTVTSGVWEAPDKAPSVEMTVQVETMSSMVITMPRVKLTAKMTMNFDKTQLGRIEITGTVLNPTKEGVGKISIGDPATVV